MGWRKVLFKIASVYWKIAKPATTGARAIMLDPSGEKVLLVRHSYIEGWYLPGGAVKKSETIVDGLKRELKEELDFTVDSHALFGVYNNDYLGKRDVVIVLLCTGKVGSFRQSGEIVEYAYFDTGSLPDGVSRGTKKRIDELLAKENPVIGIW